MRMTHDISRRTGAIEKNDATEGTGRNSRTHKRNANQQANNQAMGMVPCRYGYAKPLGEWQAQA